MLFQFRGGMVSHMQVLVTPSSTVYNNTWILTTEIISGLPACACSIRHYITFISDCKVVESSSLVSVRFIEAFKHNYISVVVNSGTSFRTFFADPYLPYNIGGKYYWVGRN